MELRYALYERTQSGYCWTWRAAGLTDALLDDFLYRIAVPNDSNAIDPGSTRGGICKFDRVVGGAVEEHVVLYRFYDGGNDAGRPNRVVMLTAWTTPQHIADMPERYGVTAIFRNKVFEYVSGNARQVGIEQPPFCHSLLVEEEVPKGIRGRMPAAALVEFIDEALTDADSNCYVTIKDNEYLLHRKPSADRERRQKEREAHERQSEVTERARDDGKASTPPDTIRRGGANDQTEGSGKLMRSGIVLASLSLCALLAVGAMQYGNLLGWGGVSLSKEAVDVVRAFKGLSLEGQRTVLRKLEEVHEQRHLQEGRQGGPMTRSAVPYRQQPTVGPTTQNMRPNRGGDPDGAVLGNPSGDPAGSITPLR